jgi:hypothetical protein
MSMSKLVAGLCLTAGLLIATTVRADDPPKPGRQLPANWSKLGLSDKQKAEIYAIEADYRVKIDDLQKQIAELRKKEKTALDAVLTDAQKARLKEILLDKAGVGDKPEKPAEKPSDKPADKKENK